MQSQFTSVEESLLSELECPVCTDYLRPPIILCVNGHNICSICRPNVPHCPTCRQQLLNTRNEALERLAREVNYPCKYRKHGCTEAFSLDLIGEHQDKCQYIPQACLVHKLSLGICTWTGTARDMKTHLKLEHSDLCMDYYGRVSYCDRGSFLISGVTPVTKHCKLVFSYNDVFYSCAEIQNGILYAVLQYIGTAEEAAKYQYKVELFNKERTESLADTHLARSFHEDLSEVQNSGKCVKLYPDQFNRFTNEKGEVAFSMEIITVGDICPDGFY